MLLSERLEGVHPDKIVGILERELAAGHEAEVRQALPRLLELHFSIAPELEAIRERLGEEAPRTAADTVAAGSATALSCGACGGALAAQAPDTVVVVCPYCGTENDVSTGATGHRWDAVIDPGSPFRIGTFFEHGERRWQVVGMQHYRGSVREWDSEDSDWETNPAEYTQWWMLDERRQLAYLGDDGRKRYWSEPVMPDDPVVPAPDSRDHEHGDWELVDVAGELSYRARPGERLLTAERMKGATGTSVERRLDGSGNPVEIGFYRERRMNDMDVLEGLGDGDSIRRATAWRRASLRFLGAAAAVVLGYLALGIVFDDAPVLEARVDGPLATATGGVGRGLGTFDTDGPFSPYRVRVRLESGLGLIPNSSVSAEIRIASTPGATDPVDAVVGVELWHETGRDSDGFWRETRYDASRTLRLPAPASYEVFAMEIESDRAASAIPSIVVSVEPNAFSGRPVLIGAILAALGFLFCRLRAGGIVGGAVSLAHVPRARGRDHRRRPDREAGTFVDLDGEARDVDRSDADGHVVGRHGR